MYDAFQWYAQNLDWRLVSVKNYCRVACGLLTRIRKTMAGLDQLVDQKALPRRHHDHRRTGKLSFFIDESQVLRGGDHGGSAATFSDQPVD